MQDNFYYIDDGPYLDSLEMLVEHYMMFPDGLPCKLQTPVAPKPNPPLPNTPHPSLVSIFVKYLLKYCTINSTKF